MKSLLLIDEPTVASLLTMEEAIKAAESALITQANGAGQLFPVVKEKYSATASFSLKSGMMPNPAVVGVKAAGSWRENPARGLPTVQATVLLVDPETGEPLALIAGKTLTTLRTGAAGGVAARLLSRENAETLAIIGTGVQGRIQAEAVLTVRPSIKTIHACNPMGQVSDAFIKQFENRVRVLSFPTPGSALAGADIIVTATPSADPLIDLQDVAPHAHINAMGADSRGKREIGQNLLERSLRFVDSTTQARSIGEHQHAPELIVTEIGRLLADGVLAPSARDAITLFDSTGIAFQDLATARQIHRLAREAGVGMQVPWPT